MTFSIDARRLQEWHAHQTIFDYELTDPDAVSRGILLEIVGAFDFLIEFEHDTIVYQSIGTSEFLRLVDEMIPVVYAGDFYYYANSIGLVGFSSLRDSFGVLASRGTVEFASRKILAADDLFASRFLRADSGLSTEGRAYFDTLLRLLPRDRYRAIGDLGS